MNRPKIGFIPTNSGIPLDRDVIREIEALGCDSLWSAGHVMSTRPATEAITSLALLSAMTDRVTVGTAVAVLPLYQPVVLAKQIAEIDRASGGRVALGVGVGGDESELRACGASRATRGRRTDESIDVLRSLWSGEPVTSAGEFWPLDGVSVCPAPTQPHGPAILVAGRSPAAMTRAAVRGDGWLPFMFSPAAYSRSVADIRSLATSAGRTLSRFEWLCLVYVRVDDDAEIALERATDHVVAELSGEREQIQGVLSRTAAVGTPELVAATLQQFVDAGVQHFVLSCCGRDDLVEQTARVIGEVGPLLVNRND